jgi:16S rRNA (guanine(527)-N(7))-methyltransferase RsmG
MNPRPLLHKPLLETELQRFKIALPPEEVESLAIYCDELARWNRRINLTSLTGPEMVRRLVVEPVWIGKQLGMSGVLADIGSGNGSPAIPLHVTSHLGYAHWIEARSRRAAFLRHMVSLLGFSNVTVRRTRFEELPVQLGRVDWITLQALKLTTQLLRAIHESVNTPTTVVWITSGAIPSTAPSEEFVLPITGTQVLLFRLDHS